MDTSLSFGEFELYPDRFELCRAGHTLRLERKPMEMLILLTVRNGHVVTRAELAEHLWGSDVFVDTEHGINTAVRKLRQALRDDPEKPRFIQTIPKLGYRFLAPVRTHPEPLPLPLPVRDERTTVESGVSLQSARWPWLVALGLGSACLSIFVAARMGERHRADKPEVGYEQLTDLTDSAVAPAISPDGHTLAFIRGDSSFASGGPVYVKSLPNGEDKLVSNDGRQKYGLAFSPDGSRIAYTVFENKDVATYTVSVFGGEPQLLLKNAAGLSWLGPEDLLYSEARSGIHLGVVTGTATGGTRDVYFPAHQRGMAHYSEPSPDHRWILVVEMNGHGSWASCRLVPLAGGSGTRVVGPTGGCTAAAWSADGGWMYFVVSVAGQSHLWRQRFPDGPPQQITSGAAEEDGLVFDRTADSLITSIGTAQSALWVHDEKGERPLSSEGEVLNGSSPPLFRKNDTVLYYLLRRRAGPAGAELWRAEPRTGKAEIVVPGFPIADYDVSADGERVVFSAESERGSELWLAPTDRSHLPTRVSVQGASFPHFGPGETILFQATEGNSNYLEQVASDGSRRSKLVSSPIHVFLGVSPGGHWAMALVSESPGDIHPTPVAIPFDGTPPRRICAGYCDPKWSSSSRFLYITLQAAKTGDAGQSLVLAAGPNEQLPRLPPEGLGVLPAVKDQPGAKLFPRADLVPGRDPDHYAFVNTAVQRNLFRVTIR